MYDLTIEVVCLIPVEEVDLALNIISSVKRLGRTGSIACLHQSEDRLRLSLSFGDLCEHLEEDHIGDVYLWRPVEDCLVLLVHICERGRSLGLERGIVGQVSAEELIGERNHSGIG